MKKHTKNQKVVSTVEACEKIKGLGLFPAQICDIVGVNRSRFDGFMKASIATDPAAPWLVNMAKLLDMPMGQMVEAVGYSHIHALSDKRQSELVERRYQKCMENKKRVRP